MLDRLPDATHDSLAALRAVPERARTLELLLVEQESELSGLLDEPLKELGYSCALADSASAALTWVHQRAPDAILVSLEGIESPLDFIADLRAATRSPILVVHAPQGNRQAVAALQRGADDYICAELTDDETTLAEVAIRLQTAIRTASRLPGGQTGELTFGNVRVDLGSHETFLGGEPVVLTRTEFRLLAQFLRAPGKVLTSEALLVSVWGEAHRKRSNYLRIYVHRLRRRLRWGGDRGERIETVRGVGYRLVGWAPNEDADL